MALIERILMNGPHPPATLATREVMNHDHAPLRVELVHVVPGLRIQTRLTTSSFADYPQYDLSLVGRRLNTVSDGACS